MKRVTTISKEGQPFVDEEVVLLPKIAASVVAAAFRGRVQQALPTGQFERVYLRWLKPTQSTRRR